MRVARWFLLALAVVLLKRFLPTYGALLPELLVAACVSVWAFATEERPLVHEAHELGVGPRALIQGVACTVVFFVVRLARYYELDVRDPRHAHTGLELATLNAVAFSVVVIPAWVETRERAHARRLSRDAWGALLMLVAGFLANELYDLTLSYTVGLYNTNSLRGALEGISQTLSFRLHYSDPHTLLLSEAVVFVGPALARFHQARPRIALGAGIVAVVSASVILSLREVARRGEVPVPFGSIVIESAGSLLPYAYALSLGPAFGDKLVRKIERRLPRSHTHA